MHNAVANGSYLFHGGYSINHYAEATAIFVLCKNKINKKYTLLFELSSLTFVAYFVHACILEVLKSFQWNTFPSVKITICVLLTTILSFFWGMIEKKLLKNPLKVLVNYFSS